MARFTCRSLLCKIFLLLALCWITSVKGKNVTVSTANSVSGSRYVAAAARKTGRPSLGPSESTNDRGNNSNFVQEEHGFPTWIAVIISVVLGFIVVSCCICGVKIRRWRKDQGAYSIWNERQLNVESMYARESGVIFQELDLEPSLTEDQCYEIPVDSFITPQRIYIGGMRVTPVKENIEDSLKSNEKRMSESAKRMALVNDAEYSAITDRISRASESTSKRESSPSTTNSVGEDTTQSPVPSPTDRSFTPGVESPGKETYCKPLPVIVHDDPVTCETYRLSKPNLGRVSALVNRPLPRTPITSLAPFAVGSSASLDRSLLKKQPEDQQKPMFQTLPRPRKIRHLQLKPLVNAITRSSSSSDVTSKEARLQAHIATDTNDCTLTRMKKRLSQSLDTLIAAQRSSHFYENPYLMLSDEDVLPAVEGHEGSEGDEDTPGDPITSHYASVHSCADSEENLPRDKEHLYARISTYMDTAEGNLNRHSYASVHYPAFTLPSPIARRPSSSRHTYVSVIFGSTDCVFKSPPALRRKPTKYAHRKSRSCSDLSSVRRSPAPALRSTPEPPKGRYVNVAEVSDDRDEFPLIQFSRPYNSVVYRKTDGDYSDDMDGIPNGGFRESNTTSSSPSPETKGYYQNVNEAFDLGPSFALSPNQDAASSRCSMGEVHHIPNSELRYVNINEALDASFVSPTCSPTSSASGVVHHIPNGSGQFSPLTEAKVPYVNINEALDASFVSPTCSPTSSASGVVHHIPNGSGQFSPLAEAKVSYVNVNEALDASFVSPTCSSASFPTSGASGVVHHIPNGSVQLSLSEETKVPYVNVNEALDVSFVSPTCGSARFPTSSASGVVHGTTNRDYTENGDHSLPTDVYKALESVSPIFVSPCSPTVHHIPNGNWEKRDLYNEECLLPSPKTNDGHKNINEVPFVKTLPSTSSSSNGSCSIVHHSYENARSVLGDSTYLADNSNSILDDSLVISECNSDVFTTSSTWNSESSNFDEESLYGIPKIEHSEKFNGLEEPFDGGTDIEIFNKRNGLNSKRDPKTLSTYLEGRLGIGVELRDHVESLATETKAGDDFADEGELGSEDRVSSKRQSCESDGSRMSSTSSLSIEEKESENQPLISVKSDVNGNSVCDRFVEGLELRRSGATFPGNHLSGESLA